MVTALNRKARLTLVLLGSLLALTLGVASGPASAEASTSPYCGGWKSAWQDCTGALRYLYQTYGWGDQASVCVAVAPGYGTACSSGAGNGVYSARLDTNHYVDPWIKNNSGGNNYVHGVALS
jgi:hypothetical protein